MRRAPRARRSAAQPPWAWTRSCHISQPPCHTNNTRSASRAAHATAACHPPELRAELRAAWQQVAGVGQRREQRRRQAVVIHNAAESQYAVAVVEVGGVAVVEAGEGEVAGHATEFDVVLAVEAPKLGGVGIVQHEAAGRGAR